MDRTDNVSGIKRARASDTDGSGPKDGSDNAALAEKLLLPWSAEEIRALLVEMCVSICMLALNF